MARWRLSRWCSFLEDTRRSKPALHGIFHRLSGAAFGISTELREMLLNVSRESFRFDEIAGILSPADKDMAWDQLVQAKILVRKSDDWMQGWHDCHVIRPRLNPAIVWQDREGNRRLVRLSDTGKCALPRQANLPALCDESLPPEFACLWDWADGSRTLSEVSRRLQASGLHAALEWLTEPCRQLIRLTSTAACSEGALRSSDLLCQNFVPAASPAARNDLYYGSEVDDARWQFDWIEPTVSHAFRFPTPAFHCRTYGQQFASAALARAILPAQARGCHATGGVRILEIGGGLGYFARDFIASAVNHLGCSIHYSIVDLSPELIRHQRETLRDSISPVTFFEQDAQNMSLPGLYDLILANEVIADLTVDHGEFETPDANSRGKTRAASVGICRLLERLWGQMKPGATAFLSEYGSLGKGPQLVEHLNHPEFAVDYSNAIAKANDIGFRTTLFDLAEFLDVNVAEMLLTGQQEHIYCLNWILRKFKAELPYAAHAKSRFLAHVDRAIGIESLSGFSFSRLMDGLHFGPAMAQFKVLMLQKPPSAA
jgi:hypothetical protein